MIDAMTDAMTDRLQQHPQAFRARSRPVVVRACFSSVPGVVNTLEGPVVVGVGDAIVTGVAGERWPIARARFLASHVAQSPTVPGEDGAYAKRPKIVWALHLEQPHSVTLSSGRGVLKGRAGDYLVQYAVGDQAIVEGSIFERTYDRLDPRRPAPAD